MPSEVSCRPHGHSPTGRRSSRSILQAGNLAFGSAECGDATCSSDRYRLDEDDPLRMTTVIRRAVGTALIFLTLTNPCVQAQIIPSLDIGCAALSYHPSDGRLLVTDRGGRVFLGDFNAPLRNLVRTAGDVRQARFVDSGNKILVVYQSGALELLDSNSLEAVTDVLPSYSYANVEVSRDGRWIVGLTTDQTAINVIEVAGGRFNKVFTYEHPMYAAMQLGRMSATQPIVPLIVAGNISLLDVEQRLVFPGPQGGPFKGLREVSVIDDHFWIAKDAGLMPLGEAMPFQGHAQKGVKGVPMIRSARLQMAAGDYYVASDDLGFSEVLKRSPDRTAFDFQTIGKIRLIPQLRDVVADPTKNAIAFCGSRLEVEVLDSGEVLLLEGARARSSVYVENMSDDASLSIVRDFEGRTAIWDNRQERFAEMLPRLPVQIFPAFGALHQKSKAYLSLGQPDVLSLARLARASIAGSALAYKTEAIPLPPLKKGEGIWNTRIVFGPADNEAFITRGQTIARLTWLNETSATPNFSSSFISSGPGKETCSSFEGVIAVSPTGRHIAIACRGGVAVFDLKDRRKLAFATPPEWGQAGERFRVWTPSITFSSDGRLLVFGVRTQRLYVDEDVSDASAKSRPGVYVFDWQANRLQAFRTGDGVPVTAVAISPDKSAIWVGGYWGSINVIERQTGHILRRFRGVQGTVFGISFDREGYANIWTDSGSISRLSAGLEDNAPSTVSFLSGALVRKTGPGRLPSKDLRREFSIVRYLPLGFLANPVPGQTLQVELAVPERHRSPVQVLLYSDADVIARGRVEGSNANGNLLLRFPIPANLSGEISVGLYSQAGGASPLIDVGKISAEAAANKSGQVVVAHVGVSQQDDPEIPALPYAAGDADALAKAWTKGSTMSHVFPIDQEPTKAAILAFLAGVRDQLAATDTLVIHLAGHGLAAGDRSYVFVAKDTRIARASQTGISANELIDLIAMGRQGATLLILDTCNGGSFIEDVLQDPRMSESPISLGLTGRDLANNISVIAAAPALQVAKEGYNGRGLLSGVLIDGLSLLKTAEKGTVKQSDLLRYVDRTLGYRSTIAFPTARQTPVLHYATRDFDILRVPDRSSP